MKIAVTGASGLVGMVAVNRFVATGHEVVAIGRDVHNLQKVCSDKALCYESDYDRKSLETAFKGMDAVVHLAARRIAPHKEGIRPFWEANVQTTEHVMRAANDSHVDRLCLASSISVYSLANRVPFSEAEPPVPLTLYGISKLACEQMAMLIARNSSIRITCLRISRILGNDQTRIRYMLMTFIQQAMKKQTLQIWGTGAGAQDTIYVRDVVSAIERAIEPEAPSGVYNIGGGRAYSTREVAETANEVFNNPGNLRFDPSREENRSVFWMDCTRAESCLQWQRQWTLKKALEDMKRQFEGTVGSP